MSVIPGLIMLYSMLTLLIFGGLHVASDEGVKDAELALDAIKQAPNNQKLLILTALPILVMFPVDYD